VIVVVFVVGITVAVCYSTGLGSYLISPQAPRSRVQSTAVSASRQTKTDVELRGTNAVPVVSESDVENPMNDTQRHTGAGGAFGTVVSMDVRPSTMPDIPPEEDEIQPISVHEVPPQPVHDVTANAPEPPVTNVDESEVIASAPSAPPTEAFRSDSRPVSGTSDASAEDIDRHAKDVENASSASYGRMAADERMNFESNPLAALKLKKKQAQNK